MEGAAAGRDLETFGRLTTAEEFLEFFAIPYDPRVVAVNRLHILQRFAMLAGLAAGGERFPAPEEGAALEAERLEGYRQAMGRAYRDFVGAGALDHRLFRVLRDHALAGFVPVADLAGPGPWVACGGTRGGEGGEAS